MKRAVKILFMGRKKVAARCLRWLLGSPNVEVVGILTDSHLDRSVTRDIAASATLPLYDIDDANAMLESGELKADLGLSMLYWRKFKGAFLTQIPLGIINYHPAPLPDYKGVGGYNLAILDGRSDWAVSAHYVDEGIDEGDIIDVHYFDIDRDQETALSLERKTQAELFEQFKKVVSRAITSHNRLKSRPNGSGRYLSRKELEKLKKVDLQRDDDLERKTRAFWFPPYDGAYIEVRNERFTLVPRSVLDGLADPDASSLFSHHSLQAANPKPNNTND